MGKRRKAEQYEVLLEGEFWGAHDTWTEYLCMERNKDGSITLTSRARQILAEAGRYKERGWLPATIRRKEVWGYDGDYVVGERLLHHDGDAEITVPQNQFQLAAEWLIHRKWDIQDDFGEAWAKIRSALYGPDFFSQANALLTRGDELQRAEVSGQGDETTPPQPDERKLHEIVIRCAGPSEPWITWLEVVFIEWSTRSFSVSARTGAAIPGAAVSLGLLPRTAGRLSWRDVLQFVQSHDWATISGSDPQPIDIYGVEHWQRDVIAAAMMRLSTIVPLLSNLPERELQSLHERLDGFLSQASVHLLSDLASVKGGPLRARKSLVRIAQLVGSSDALDIERLAEDCEAYLADWYVDHVLAKHRDNPKPPPRLFLSLLNYRRPRHARLRAGLFELWLRATPKPKGGLLYGTMDDELPVLHWLLREQAAEVFQSLVGTHHKDLQEFVSWFLGEARQYTEYFTGSYKFTSFIAVMYGRPRFAAWARLAKEVQDAATSLGIAVPEAVLLPAMPDLEAPMRALSMTFPAHTSPRRLQRIAEELSGQNPRDAES